MCARKVVTVILILLTANSQVICSAHKTRCPDGWFGSKCQFQCHCANSTKCSREDGTCDSGCGPHWFGPGCQYKTIAFKARGGSSLDWLTDKDDGTCNNGNTQTAIVSLNPPIPLSRIRIKVKDKADLYQIMPSYLTESSLKREQCDDLRLTRVTDTTLDMYCLTSHNVFDLILSGHGVKGLCSLYISAGRNMALKQPADQSSLYLDWYASNAVDGKVDVRDDHDSQRATCTHTNSYRGPTWWTVTFSKPVYVYVFLIHNRRGSGDEGCCEDRLIGFSLTATLSSGSQTYQHTDPGGPAQDLYTLIPSPRISLPVKKVRIDRGANKTTALTLCEVKVFGDCPLGTYGDCSESCSSACAGPSHACDPFDGSCASCSPGYLGKQCERLCPRGLYGQGCNQSCSDNCGGENSPCHHVDGSCYRSFVPDNQTKVLLNTQRGRQESGDSSQETWLIAGAIIAAVVLAAVLVIGILAQRLRKASRNQAPEPANGELNGGLALNPLSDVPEDSRERLVQDDVMDNGRESQAYDVAIADPHSEHLYDADYGEYTNHLGAVRESGTYLTPQDTCDEPCSSKRDSHEAQCRGNADIYYNADALYGNLKNQ